MALMSFARKFVPENSIIIQETLFVKDGVNFQDKDPSLVLFEKKADIIKEKLEAARKDECNYIDMFDIISALKLSRDSVAEALERAYHFLQKALLLKTLNKCRDELQDVEKYMCKNDLGSAENFRCRLKVASVYFKFGMNSLCDKILCNLLAESKKHSLCMYM